jgi:dihydrofolate synthase / folylpolyglutamate synthase
MQLQPQRRHNNNKFAFVVQSCGWIFTVVLNFRFLQGFPILNRMQRKILPPVSALFLRLNNRIQYNRPQQSRLKGSCDLPPALLLNRGPSSSDSLRRSLAFSSHCTRLFSSTVDRIIDDDMINNNSSSSTKNYTEYEKWVRRLYATNMFHPVKLGLTNIIQLHEAIGNPMDRVCVVHIAGTNGKGSVALKIAKTLEYSNPSLRIGLFCSPHVSSFRERMQVNGELIEEQEVVELLPEIYSLCKEHDIPATFFEITTALAFRFFESRNVDVVVLETGLGGRLDATNVIRSPAVAVITSIGLEHTRILGDTIELIALEKGGIIKPGRPVLVGPNVPHEVLRQCAKEKGASGYYTCEDILGEVAHVDATATVVTHQGDYDMENARVAKAAIKLLQQSHPEVIGATIPDDVIQRGTSQRPPCRFEIVNRTCNEKPVIVILDVAHNPPAMDYLSYKLRSTYRNAKFRVVVGMSSDKDMSLCAKALKTIVDGDIRRIHLVEAAHPRASKLEQMFDVDTELRNTQFDVMDRSITHQLSRAMQMVATATPVAPAHTDFASTSDATVTYNNDILVVCGSVFLMAEAREALQFDEPRDSPYIAELAGAGVRHGQENFGNSSTAFITTTCTA